MVSIDSESSEKLIVLGVILALLGLVLLLVVALIFVVDPSGYDNGAGIVRNMIYAGAILIAIGAAMALVLYARE